MEKSKMNPKAIRLTDEDMQIIQRIIETVQQPGMRVTLADAIRIALQYWNTHHRTSGTAARRTHLSPRTRPRACGTHGTAIPG